MANPALFPASRELFKLVRNISRNIEAYSNVSDVEIGRVIGFESARTSRWKHGQIAVTDAPRLLALAQAFDIDISLLTQVAAGYLSASDCLKILRNNSKLVRFFGDHLLLPTNDLVLRIAGDDGTQCSIKRHSQGHYQRRRRLTFEEEETPDKKEHPKVLLVDDDKAAIEVFHNLTGTETGIEGIVARAGTEALLIAGRTRPQMIIMDLFIGQLDGFAALRHLATDPATADCEIYASSLVRTPELVRTAMGSGALDVLQRPLRSRVLGRLLGRIRKSLTLR